MIEVRKYENKDLDSVNNILEEAFDIRKSNFSYDNMIEIVGTIDGDVVGYLILTKVLNPIKNKYYYLIDYVCVATRARGKGVGHAMINYAEENAREDHAMYLQLTCSYKRVAAHKLYEGCGFIKRDSDIFRKVL